MINVLKVPAFIFMLVCLIVVMIGGSALGDILGSAHDFSNEAWNPRYEICVACHTPHNADTSVYSAPLWNHEITTTPYTIYISQTTDAIVSQPSGSSLLCLSCHDGQVAQFDIKAELDKVSGHDPRLYVGVHDPVEMLAGSQPHVECSDCHNPHAAASARDEGDVPSGRQC